MGSHSRNAFIWNADYVFFDSLIAAFFSCLLAFFSSGVLRSARTLRVCTVESFWLPTCTRPCMLPSRSREMFFFWPTLSCFGCFLANLYKSSEAIFVRRTIKSMDGPISLSSIRGVFNPDFFSTILCERMRIWLSSVAVKLSTCSTPCKRIAFTWKRKSKFGVVPTRIHIHYSRYRGGMHR